MVGSPKSFGRPVGHEIKAFQGDLANQNRTGVRRVRDFCVKPLARPTPLQGLARPAAHSVQS